jgi:hypothetical protein
MMEIITATIIDIAKVELDITAMAQVGNKFEVGVGVLEVLDDQLVVGLDRAIPV